jgi:integrase/recombinase XerD
MYKGMNKSNQKHLRELAQYLKAVGYQKGTQKTIILGCKQFIKWLKMPLEQTTRAEIKTYHKYLENRPNQLFEGGLSSKMIRDYLWAISLLFKLLEQDNKLLKNPMSGYPLPRVTSQRREVLELEEIQALYKVTENLKEVAILHIYYGLGLRRSEGVSLNLEDVDYKNGWLYVNKGKGGKGRNIPLTPKLQKDLKAYVLEYRKSIENKAFLLNTKDRRLQGQSAIIILKKLLERANITKKIDLHCLRHSIATHLIHKGMPLEQVRDFLGHSHLESTQNYIHYEPRKVSKS